MFEKLQLSELIILSFTKCLKMTSTEFGSCEFVLCEKGFIESTLTLELAGQTESFLVTGWLIYLSTDW